VPANEKAPYGVLLPRQSEIVVPPENGIDDAKARGYDEAIATCYTWAHETGEPGSSMICGPPQVRRRCPVRLSCAESHQVRPFLVARHPRRRLRVQETRHCYHSAHRVPNAPKKSPTRTRRSSPTSTPPPPSAKSGRPDRRAANDHSEQGRICQESRPDSGIHKLGQQPTLRGLLERGNKTAEAGLDGSECVDAAQCCGRAIPS
jgi:hypothetical protein